ncbi:NAD-dependent deacetylase [Anaeroplasma bactoclasticum]|jgi:NAD-dependent deacetylase|uniref:NAD-dependent protein deacetylase n=1 Tax=Anaeroplasma bactoclasticum TaxID=2088 RepID=A0A397QV09_9MOLU|nr:NAD-dependent protein deacylase [Anaeroplasma bactoclasticum]RIA64882.1 NAD-dependent deacetylase [Anaeroplasma bactoclasticum]
MNKLEELKQVIDKSKRIVIFSGAGLSTNSGIPDFRSADGLYNQKTKMNIPPEEIISHSFFMRNPEEFYKFYFSKMVYLNAKPNLAHKYFAKLEQMGKVSAVVTQNIDNLHQEAGSKVVYELHGSVMRNYCMRCHKFYSLSDIFNEEGRVPRCDCGGLIKPDVVLYEEGLDDDTVSGALHAISEADTIIVTGTSLTVYPAAGFLRYFRGENLILLNKSETPYDSYATIAIHDDIKNVIEYLEK